VTELSATHETQILHLLMKMSLILFELFGWNQRNRASFALVVKLARRRYGTPNPTRANDAV
jgi:hypothetical protein